LFIAHKKREAHLTYDGKSTKMNDHGPAKPMRGERSYRISRSSKKRGKKVGKGLGRGSDKLQKGEGKGESARLAEKRGWISTKGKATSVIEGGSDIGGRKSGAGGGAFLFQEKERVASQRKR